MNRLRVYSTYLLWGCLYLLFSRTGMLTNSEPLPVVVVLVGVNEVGREMDRSIENDLPF